MTCSAHLSTSRRADVFPCRSADGSAYPRTGRVVAVCRFKRSVPDTAVLPRLRVAQIRRAEYAREDITAHLLAAELLRIHLHADQCRGHCFTSIISVAMTARAFCSAAGLWCAIRRHPAHPADKRARRRSYPPPPRPDTARWFALNSDVFFRRSYHYAVS